jgi:hypothetical protein
MMRPHAIMLEPQGNEHRAGGGAPPPAARQDPVRSCWCCRPTMSLPTVRLSMRPCAVHELAGGAGRAGDLRHHADQPETGYGYILSGQAHGQTGNFAVERFVEKPDLERAKTFLADGRYYWNSGMFLLRARDYLEELEAHRPLIAAAVKEAMSKAYSDLDFCRLTRLPLPRRPPSRSTMP